jgi:hypothetical protein
MMVLRPSDCEQIRPALLLFSNLVANPTMASSDEDRSRP